MSAAEKTERVMGALMDHLRVKYALLSSSNVFRLQTNAAGTLTLILDLLSPKIDSPDSQVMSKSTGDVQFLRDINCGLQYLPTFQIVFTPMAIVSDQDSPPPSSRTLFNVLLVNYQGTILKKDFMTFYVNFPIEVIEAAKAAAAEAAIDEDGAEVLIDPDVELADKTSSNCELLHKLDRYREFRLCCGIRKNRKTSTLRLGSVFVEPFGDSRTGYVVRSRDCRFMLELESSNHTGPESGERDSGGGPENCHCCQQLENKVTEFGMEKLKQLSRVKVEVKDERSGATLVMPVGGDDGLPSGVDDQELLAVVEMGEDGQTVTHRRVVAGEDPDEDHGGYIGVFEDDLNDEDYDAGKENEGGKVSAVIKGGGSGDKAALFKCESCGKEYKYIDSYWKCAKKCGRTKGQALTDEQKQMMVTLKDKGDKHTCSNCGRDFFHEVNWRKHEDLCKVGRVKGRAVYKQDRKPKVKKPKIIKTEAKGAESGAEGVGEAGATGEDGSPSKKPKEIRECLICLKKVGNQWERHIRLHKERVGEKLFEQTVCPSWDCEQVFEDRIKLNKHFLETHDVEAIPCVYCLRLILKDRIQQHLRNEHPHMSHMCTECGRECIYPSALKQHIKEFHLGVREAMCDLCGKSYPNERSLRKHLKTHAIQREHVCPECGKDFLTSTKLNEHRRVHTGAKPFQCKVCAYRAGKKENVQAHVKKVHSISANYNEYVLIIQEELVK